jgi:two-component system, chemotaxis family, sensor kinase CheA
MDVRRFLDLYEAETQEHVRILQRSLLDLERDGSGGALDEAFRAAHTLKGVSASMGFAEATRLAHELEDQLDQLRHAPPAGAAPVPVDALLAAADALEREIAAATAGSQAMGDIVPAAVTPAPQGPGLEPGAVHSLWPAAAALPPGVAAAAVVRLHAEAPMKAVRALLVLRALAGRDDLLGSEPAAFPDDFDGLFRVHFGSTRDLASAEADIRGAGDVADVQFLVGRPAQPWGKAAPPPAPRMPAAATRAAAVLQAAAIPLAVPAPGVGMTGRKPSARQLRVDAERLDAVAGGIGELSILFNRVAADAVAQAAAGDTLDRMSFILGQLQQDVVDLRMVAVAEAFERLPRVVRDAARRLGKDVDLDVSGEDVRLDRMIIDELHDPLVHLLRNAVDHGIEPGDARLRAGKPARGRIQVHAERERTGVRITVSDDGGGVAADRVAARARAAGLLGAAAPAVLTDDDLFRLLSQPGLSTAADVGDVSGRGVGMDVVVSRLRALGGAIEMRTRPGTGTTFTLRLPVTLALAQALRVRVGGEDYAIPLTHVAEAVDLDATGGGAVTSGRLRLRGESIPLVSMRTMLQLPDGGGERAAIVARSGARCAALAVDEVVGREQILVKTFDAATGTLPLFSGATLLADGRPVLVLDPLSVL